ncbi:unnamed protein product [Allacma fusca]|uniref:Uncharacterized protein n=1 Tax=Allacma fusca TaxID=39272 RepID=A0A8J2KEN7_9HEXA|nr:unnamed protein product [Allacma fusca]
MELMKKLLKELASEVKTEIQTSEARITAQISGQINDLQDRCERLEQKNHEQEREIEELRRDNNFLRNELRKTNVFIGGIPESKDETRSTLISDIVLMSPRPNDLQSQNNILQRYFDSNDLEVNLTKTKILPFSKGTRPSRKFYWKGAAIETVSQYKYLGIEFTQPGLFNTHLKAAMLKSRQAIGTLLKTLSGAKVKDIEVSKNFSSPWSTAYPCTLS